MDRYKASIDSIDSALNRLNQTMAAYKIFKKNGHATADSVDERIDIDEIDGAQRLQRLAQAIDLVSNDPYNLVIHTFVAIEYLGLGYPDLATGSAYKALLLTDAAADEAEEYHDDAFEALTSVVVKHPPEERTQLLSTATYPKDEPDSHLEVEILHWLDVHYRLIIYRIFVRSLAECASFRSAHTCVARALRSYPDDAELLSLQKALIKAVESRVKDPEILKTPSKWPENGWVRREIYPWNDLEPDRLNELSTLNEMMQKVAPKLEVRAVELPNLSSFNTDGARSTITQLGVFAKEDLHPGQVILNETSLLTANNRLQDALCDACSCDLPDLSSASSSAVSCPDCDVIFCSQECLSAAETYYHPAVCTKDLDSIAKNVPPADAANALYALLLLRTFALSETQNIHPLDLPETKYLWGEFEPTPSTFPSIDDPLSYFDLAKTITLPFNFSYNVTLPLHMLEKMDLDIFTHPAAEVWIFNTLYAKFRGTASARLSGKAGKGPARGPEVGAVHPLWCLANHSCDPNVTWDWGGSVKFEVRKERVEWTREGDGSEKEEVSSTTTTTTKKKKKTKKSSSPGVKKGEEILNHYCDVDLKVADRRAWAVGALGGNCTCERCKWEAGEE